MDRETIHAVAWATWLGAAVAALITIRNPIYLGLILLWIGVVSMSLRQTGQIKQDAVPFSPLHFALMVIPLATLFNMLSVHIGTTVLTTLPRSLPLIGGPITLEAALYGSLNGLVLTGLFAAFLLLNQALTVRSLVGLIPRAYYPVAVIVAIGITFVPITLAQFKRIQEAQAIRGHRLRGVRSWLPLFLPLLMSGIERALQLAEAMTARGFASQEAEQDVGKQAALLAGLCLVAGGIMGRLIWNFNRAGLALIAIGTLLVMVSLWRAGRQQSRTTYRPAPILPHDWLIIGASLLLILSVLVPNPLLDRASLYYYPYPTVVRPAFHVGLGLATCALLTPALVLLALTGRTSPQKL